MVLFMAERYRAPYFKNFSYCESGLIPWLLIWELLSQKNFSMTELISDRKREFLPVVKRILREKLLECLQNVKKIYAAEENYMDDFDGLSVSFENWRLNLRQSNTESFCDSI